MGKYIDHDELFKDLDALGIVDEDIELVRTGADTTASVPEPEPEPEAQIEAEPEVVSPRFVTEESFQELQNKLNLYQRQIDEGFKSLRTQPSHTPAPATQAPAPKPKLETYIVDEYGEQHPDPVAAEVNRLQELYEKQSKTLESLQAETMQSKAQQFNNYLGSIVHELKSKYPDFHEHVPVDKIVYARDEAIRQGQFGSDWRRALEQEYAVQVIPKLMREKDELAKKRDEKRDTQAQAASVVPSGGSTYQAPKKVEHNPKERGYASARAGFKADFDAALGG